jgi:hypothetical protein
MTLPKRLVSLLLIYCFVIALAPLTRAEKRTINQISNGNSDPATETSSIGKAVDLVTSWFSSKTPRTSDDEDAAGDEGLHFRLSEAPDQPEARPVSKLANATVLSDAETQAILNRLPQIKAEPSDETDFALREKSLPPPRTGATVMQAFPAERDQGPRPNSCRAARCSSLLSGRRCSDRSQPERYVFRSDGRGYFAGRSC